MSQFMGRQTGKSIMSAVACVATVASGVRRVTFCTLDKPRARADIEREAKRFGVSVAIEDGDECLYVEAAK